MHNCNEPENDADLIDGWLRMWPTALPSHQPESYRLHASQLEGSAAAIDVLMSGQHSEQSRHVIKCLECVWEPQVDELYTLNLNP